VFGARGEGRLDARPGRGAPCDPDRCGGPPGGACTEAVGDQLLVLCAHSVSTETETQHFPFVNGVTRDGVLPQARPEAVGYRAGPLEW